jgi:hypothetical protein
VTIERRSGQADGQANTESPRRLRSTR